MRTLLLLLLAVTASHGINIDIPLPLIPIKIDLPDILDLPLKIGGMFAQFGKEFKRNYADENERKAALKAFTDNVKNMIKLNLDFKGKGVEFGINQFSDLTPEEFKAKMLIDKPDVGNTSLSMMPEIIEFPSTAEAYDWRSNKNVVGPVKNQGSCGSCWAFTAAAVITGAYGKKNGKLMEASEQQIADCSGPSDRPGCNGGWIDYGLRYAKDHGVSATGGYTAYNPSRAKTTGTCDHNGKANNIRISGYSQVKGASALANAVLNKGPVGVGFAVGASFQHYKSGIYDNSDCTQPGVGWHAVTVVGYGIENGKQYWICKNSWSTGWGEAGYFKFARGKDLCYLESTMCYSADG